MSIANDLKSSADQQARDNWARYVALLQGESTPASVAELHDVMGALGKSADDVARDVENLRRATSTLDHIQRAKGSRTAFEQAHRDLDAVKENAETSMRKFERDIEDAATLFAQRSQQYDAATQHVNTLNRLKAENEMLLRSIAPATYDDIA